MNMNKGSMIEIAIQMLKSAKAPLSFQYLWNGVKTALEISPEEEADRIGSFYTDLSLSGMTLVLRDDRWDLAERQPVSNKVDMSDVYSDVDQTSGDAEDAKDDEEYDLAVTGDLRAEETEAAAADHGNGHAEEDVSFLGDR